MASLCFGYEWPCGKERVLAGEGAGRFPNWQDKHERPTLGFEWWGGRRTALPQNCSALKRRFVEELGKWHCRATFPRIVGDGRIRVVCIGWLLG